MPSFAWSPAPAPPLALPCAAVQLRAAAWLIRSLTGVLQSHVFEPKEGGCCAVKVNILKIDHGCDNNDTISNKLQRSTRAERAKRVKRAKRAKRAKRETHLETSS